MTERRLARCGGSAALASACLRLHEKNAHRPIKCASEKGNDVTFSAAPTSRLQIWLVGLIISMTRLKSPSVLCSRLGFPHLSIEEPHAHPIQRRCPTALRRGGRSPGEGPAAGERRRRGDRRAPSTWEAVRLREAIWYPTRNAGASEAIQISANRAECVCRSTTFAMRSCLRAA